MLGRVLLDKMTLQIVTLGSGDCAFSPKQTERRCWTMQVIWKQQTENCKSFAPLMSNQLVV